MRKYLKSLQLKEKNEQESEVFSERDGEDAGIDEDADSLVAKENLADVEENADDTENDQGDDEIEEDKLAEVSEESSTEEENEQESEVFSERDGEDAGIDEDADSLVAKENLSDVEENADDSENDLGDDEIEEDKLAEVSEESSTEGENERESGYLVEMRMPGLMSIDSLVVEENLSDVEENAMILRMTGR